VMIFMLSLLVLLIRNMELVNELRATIEAERQAAEQARSTGEEKESLALQLMATENEVSMLRVKLLRMEELREHQEAAIASRGEQLAAVSVERDQLMAEVGRLSERARQLDDLLDSTRRSVANLEEDFSRLSLRHQAANEALEALRLKSSTSDAELSAARERLRASDLRVATIENDYTDLKTKYERLIRPARSPSGRYVVEVHYAKSDGAFRIDLKTPEDAQPRRISRAELNEQLDRLKAQHREGLYVRVIFPENSGLSYNEAWQFTSELHKSYDYYFQQGSEANTNR